MCDIGMALTIGSTLLSVAGTVQGASAEKSAARYQEGVARNNAILAERAAVDAEDRGRAEAEEARRRSAVIRGAQRAGFGAAGVALDEGTPVDVLATTRLFGELDARTATSNAEREALGYRTQGMNFTAEADMARFRRKQVSSSLPLQIGGTLIGGAVNTYGAYRRNQFYDTFGKSPIPFYGVGGSPY